MIKLGLIHTVKAGYLIYESEIHKRIKDIVVYNLLDDYLARESSERSFISTSLKFRLLAQCKLFEKSGMDLIACTCSSMSLLLNEIRNYLDIPLVSVDEYMIEIAAKRGGNILVFATAQSASSAVVSSIKRKADEFGVKENISTLLCDEAGKIVRAGGDMKEHDRLVLESFKNVSGCEVVVFAQTSNSHMADPIKALYGYETFTNLEYCITDIENAIEELHRKQ